MNDGSLFSGHHGKTAHNRIMGNNFSSVVESGVSNVNQANIALNQDKFLQIFQMSSLLGLFISILLIIIGAPKTKKNNKKKQTKGKDEPATSDTLFAGLVLLLLSIISLVIYNFVAAIRHPKAFAVMETAAMVTNVV